MSPLREIPGGNGPEIIRTDLLHALNLGWGGDLAAGVLFALRRLHAFGQYTQPQLNNAFEKFDSWCANNQKSHHVKCFEPKTFKVQTLHGDKLFR